MYYEHFGAKNVAIKTVMTVKTVAIKTVRHCYWNFVDTFENFRLIIFEICVNFGPKYSFLKLMIKYVFKG